MSSNQYFLSRFAKALQKNEGDEMSGIPKSEKTNDLYCVYNSLTQQKIFGGKLLKELLNLFNNPTTLSEAKRKMELQSVCDSLTLGKMLADLVEIGVIITNKQDDLDCYNHLFGHGMALRETRLLYLHPTTDCNLRCKYCFVEDDQQRPFVPCKMDMKTAQKSVDVFAHLTQGGDEILLNFYGGEPLLNKPVVYETMRYVRELEKQEKFTRSVEMTLQTNGLLVDDETVRVLKETGSLVSLSLDGPQQMHDAMRVMCDGSYGSFEKALQSYKRLQDAGVTVSPSVTLSSANIEHIDEVVDFIIDELKPQGMGFNPLIPRIGGSNPVDTDPEFTTQQLIKAFKRLREHGIYEDRMMRRIKPYTEEQFHFKDCMGVGGQLAISPQGKIGPCQAYLGCDEYFPLDVNALHAKLPSLSIDDIYADSMFHEWSHRFPLNMKDCIDCHAISVCGGGCPYAAHANAGSIWEIDERICHQAKQIFEWMIWETYDAMVAEYA